MELLTIILTALGSGTFTAVILKWMDRRRDAADTRLKNAEADKNELSNKRTEVDHYRTIINDLVTDMETLGRAQDATDARYQQNTDGLHQKVDKLTSELEKANKLLTQANKTIDELQIEVKGGGEKTDALVKQLDRANQSLDDANKEIKGLREVITGLQEKVAELLTERAEKK